MPRINVRRGRVGPATHTLDLQGLRWWNVHCEAALTAVATTPQGKSCRDVLKSLRHTITEAKRGWSNDSLINATADTLWKATM